MLEFKLIYGLDGYEKAKPLREEVFMDEQGFTFDYDEMDAESWHIVGYDDDELIGTARMHKYDDISYKIGRVAVKKSYRRGYVGDLMMKTLQNKIVSLGSLRAVVSAQLSVKDFYTFEGYVPFGDIYEIDGVAHTMMELDLTKPHRSCSCGKEN